jgi:large subunit ribosomal protein L24e
MKKEECEFSGYAVHPGHGRRYVPFAFISTKPVLVFSRPKAFALYMRKRNPREVPWTRTFRRLHRKHVEEGKSKRRVKKAVRAPRAIVGADLAYIEQTRAKNAKKEDRTAKGKAVKAELAERKAATKK